jgi:Ca2+-binding RTX toxin-like protein
MRQRTETFIDAFAETTPDRETTSSEGSRASGQSTDTALAMPPLLAADAPLPTAPADTNSLLHRDVFLSTGNDVYFLSTFYSPTYTYTVYGFSGNDRIAGYIGNDTIIGDEGNDWLHGGAGADVLSGGDGFDVASYQYATAGVSIDLTMSSSFWTGDAQGDVLTSIEQIDLTSFGDSFVAAGAAFTVHGFGGNDWLDGSAGNDSLYGGADHDYLFGEAADDFLYGEEGNDWLDGGAGDDLLDGGSGADALWGGDGYDHAAFIYALTGVTVDLADPSLNAGDAAGDSYSSIEDFSLTPYDDTFIGADAAVTVSGFGGSDWLYGSTSNDFLYGDAGNDYLFGEAGKDLVVGDDGNDWIDGGTGDDLVIGGAGGDVLDAGVGNDFLVGGLGGDFLVGGADADIFNYSAVEDSQNLLINGVLQQDQIWDFTQGQDKIALSAIDANVYVAGDQAFRFIGDPSNHTGDDWTGVICQLTWADGTTSLGVSIDADSDGEMLIYMSHPYQFTASDFIL